MEKQDREDLPFPENRCLTPQAGEPPKTGLSPFKRHKDYLRVDGWHSAHQLKAISESRGEPLAMQYGAASHELIRTPDSMRIVTILQTITAVSLLTLFLASLPRSAVAADPEAGAKVFSAQCASCHAAVAGKKGLGPSLFGVVGREAGRLPEFRYSEATKTSGLIWDEANLDRYVANPRAVISGTTMPYAGLKNDTQRDALIEYLATLK